MKMMVTLDGSKFAEAAIEPAARLAKDAKAQVFLVQVVELKSIRGTPGDGPEEVVEAVRAEYTPEGGRLPSPATRRAADPRAAESLGLALDRAMATAKDYLRRVSGAFAPLQPELVALVGDDVDAELVKFAKDRRVDLIAMATHGRTGLARVVMGSHAANMLGQQVAPLMVVRPDQLRQTEEPAAAGR
jgi:nucleotide-binding universal stress UspA family protein